MRRYLDVRIRVALAMQGSSAAAAAEAPSSPPLYGTPPTTLPSTASTPRYSAYASFSDVLPIQHLRASYSHLQAGEKCEGAGKVIRIAGRIVSVRDLGKILFVTLRSDGEASQLCANVGPYFTRETLDQLKASITTGDIVGAEGFVGKTKQGELTLFVTNMSVLAPYVCTDLTVIPDQRTFTSPTASLTSPLETKKPKRSSRTKSASPSLPSQMESTSPSTTASAPQVTVGRTVVDPDLKYRYRFIDMITDPSTVQTFRDRHKIIQTLRSYLDGKGFTEVETPMFHAVPCGANAKPFTTHHNANDTDLFLRIAPELYLKQCVVGGMERVYEIGKVFRNEDSDRSHNPEFTSCEFYASYCTYEDLMPMTEDILRAMAVRVCGAPTMEVVVNTTEAGSSAASPRTVTIDLSKPFKRVSVYSAVQEAAGVTLPPPSELNTPTGIAFLAAIMLQHGIPLPSARTAAKFFDKLIDHFITDHIVEPTFVCDHPLCMSPLAKESPTHSGLSERFELFINGMEICNAYSELNDPTEQLRRFEQQLQDKELGDDEAMSLDETFLKALQTGLPPTAGWGMGIDRVVMLLTKKRTIRDVMIFPLLRPDDTSHDAKRRKKTASFFGFNQQMTLFCLSALEAELQRRGQLGMKVEHLKALRRTVLELSRRRTELEEQLVKCREAAAANGAPCSLWVKLLQDLLCGRGAQ